MNETKTTGNSVGQINMPEKKFRAGTVSATVWQNRGKSAKGGEVTFRTVSFQRNYMDRNGTWQTSSSLRVNDLPRASVVLQKAYEYIILSNVQEQGNDTVAIEEVI